MASPTRIRASRPSRLVPTLLIAAAGFAALAPASAVSAQSVRMAVTSGGPIGGGMGRPAMSTKELDGYSKILELDEDQVAAAKELLATYTAEYEAASKEQGEQMRRISEEFRETRDDEVWQQMGPVGEKFSKRTKELETTLLADIKSLCSEKQLNSWPKLERTRRRDRTIDRGMVSGESIDLVRVIRSLELTPDGMKPLADQIEAYEQDLDRALVERNKIMDEQAAGFTLGRGPVNLDIEKMQEQGRLIREAGEKVRDVNARYSRSFAGLLPDDARPRFEMEVKRSTFPAVYRPSRASRSFDAALKFADLDAKQKEAITTLRQTYEQEIVSLNEKWAAAVVEEEKSSAGMGFGGGMVMMSFGDDDENKPTTEPKKARREADRKALANLEALLTEEQKGRLPKAGDDAASAAPGQLIIGR